MTEEKLSVKYKTFKYLSIQKFPGTIIYCCLKQVLNIFDKTKNFGNEETLEIFY